MTLAKTKFYLKFFKTASPSSVPYDKVKGLKLPKPRRLVYTPTSLTISVLLSGGIGYYMYKILRGDERLHREWVVPMVHRWFAPESAHILGVKAVRLGFLDDFVETRKEYPELACQMFGKQLNNPIGLAAGFDKNGEAIEGLRKSGFGFIEIGTVTPKAQIGNERPRVFRLREDQAVINSYGFNNDGIGTVLDRVKKASVPDSGVPLGVNLGKNKTAEDAAHDLGEGIVEFSPYSDYLVVNISSPNTPGLRDLQRKKELKKLLLSLGEVRQKCAVKPPLFVKISPDLSSEQLADIAEVCTDQSVKVDGLIVTNTTKQRSDTLKNAIAFRTGGLSGAPLRDMSTRCIAETYRLTRGQIPIIGCGGISSGADAYEKIKAGASAVQLYTAIVFQGFPVVGRVKRELTELLQKDGYAHVSEAVGAQHRKK
ncbi:hypothetical protein niasHT_016117 [Heterodera trifolii]|uniref:Dihydroorotate dehydrogenase (quinone), mitochondrial n=1 Tax=Heterodera trifolii TaxID=157864 RepID=A0ABD2L284_9BILA